LVDDTADELPTRVDALPAAVGDLSAQEAADFAFMHPGDSLEWGEDASLLDAAPEPPVLLPIAEDPSLDDRRRSERAFQRAFWSTARFHDLNRSAPVPADPRTALGDAQMRNPLGHAMSNLVMASAWGSSHGLPRVVFDDAMRRHVADELEGRLPVVGESAVDNAVRLMEERMRNPLVHLYIGITEAPARRWAERYEGAASSHSARFTRMSVVQEANTSAESSVTERTLISIARRRWGHRCLNQEGTGGEGASASSPHYVYVVWREGLR